MPKHVWEVGGGLDLARFHDAIMGTINKRGLTLTQAANKAGVHRMTISRMDSNDQCPSVDAFMRLLKWSGLRAERFHRVD